MPKTLCLLLVLGLALGWGCRSTGEQGLKQAGSSMTSPMSYQVSLDAFDRIEERMEQSEVRTLLGNPDRVHRGDPGGNWYDESWTYDFRKLDGFPKMDKMRAIWEGTVMFLKGKVVHTRKIGWLE